MTKLPTFPSFDLSKLDPAQFEILGIDSEKLTNALRDATYVTVGFGVLAFQQAQVRRRELITSLSDRFGTTTAQMDELLNSFEARVDERVAKLEDRLPAQAGALLVQAHGVAKAARKQVRGFLRAAA